MTNPDVVYFIGATIGVLATIVAIKAIYGKWFWEIKKEA